MKTLKFEYKTESGSRKTFEVLPLNIEFIDWENGEKEWVLKAKDLQGNEKSFLLKNLQRCYDAEVQRYFCVTVYVMNKNQQFLMLLNKKLNRWVPPGGKIDNHETPEEAAVRECYEETGIHVQLIGEMSPVDGGLMNPRGMQLNPIIPDVHDHVDFIYFAKPIESEVLNMSQREAAGIGWFSYEEVLKLETFPSVLQWTKIFLKNL